ncbi:hypothetical protein EHS25_008720 [Saitozyma podzolica]|uniref:EF-hand domain-containing protein n=1 Tax=Saitozyma podzolica TaxID=1890683 RepID=A0A427YMJ0_9TREE|nr:hypothetical protein EHS25_008720 [Saitozyma podzolica]
MSAATRRSTRNAASAPTDADTDADAEFLALPARQRRAVDRAFDRGLAQAGRGNGRKRRKLATSSGLSTPGGFDVNSGGGFLNDVDVGRGGFMEAGGFLPDINDKDGGFIPDDDAPSASVSSPPTPSSDRLPLRFIPGLLAALKLPSDDDVLEVFRASASGWEDYAGAGAGAGSSKRRGREEEAGVERKDFRAMSEEEEGEDVYIGEESESSLSSLSSDSEYGGRRKGKGRPGKDAPPGKPTRRSKKALEESGPVKLSSRQREVVRDIWDMLKPDSSARGGNILGRDEVKRLVRDLGEMWSDDEITEMVTLFSTQHEQRGLSFDDFGAVMLRAGLL